ncbi:MAG: J domain-containing protein [Acidimicrobiales bacterium]
MLLAELEVFQSRPIAPTRRVALGRRDLPVSPAPGFGGILLAGIVAGFVERIDPDLHPDLVRLSHQLEQGLRIPQPRLRHRLQTDHVGLNRRTHRLYGDGEQLRISLDEPAGTIAAPQVLAAMYAAGQLTLGPRTAVMHLLRKALRWSGAVDDSLVEYLTGRSGSGGWLAAGAGDPVEWARFVLGIEDGLAARKDIQRAFRDSLRRAHPDHGAAAEGAAQRIADLAEARRILLAS